MNSSIIVLDDSIFFLKSLLAHGVDVGFYSLETDELLYAIETDTTEEGREYFFVRFSSSEEVNVFGPYSSVKEILSDEDEFEKDLLDNKFGIRSLSGY